MCLSGRTSTLNKIPHLAAQGLGVALKIAQPRVVGGPENAMDVLAIHPDHAGKLAFGKLLFAEEFF